MADEEESAAQCARIAALAKVGREWGLVSLAIGDIAIGFDTGWRPPRAAGEPEIDANLDEPSPDDGMWDHVGVRPKKGGE